MCFHWPRTGLGRSLRHVRSTRTLQICGLELRQSEVLLVTPGENTPFTKAEQRIQISSREQQIRTFITTTYELTADQLTEVDERLGDIERRAVA